MTTTGTHRRRFLTEEREWLPLLEEFDLRQLREGFVAQGVSPQTAGGLVWFLADQASPDLSRGQSPNTRTRYRAILGALDIAAVRRAAARAIPGLFNSALAA